MKYVCCFCEKGIEKIDAGVTALIVVKNWEKELEEQQEQLLFCHVDCLREKIAPTVKLYVTDI